MIRAAFILGVIVVVVGAVVCSHPGGVYCAATAGVNDSNLIKDARYRIKQTFSQPQAKPVIAHFDHGDANWPLKLNDYGSTVFLPWKTCVILGPKGQNTDVAAHELMHAEIAHRIGYWQRMTKLPTWFDEGLAMQVDHRARYSQTTNLTELDVARLNQASQFFVPDDEQLTIHYAAAKKMVGHWVDRQGHQLVFKKLDILRPTKQFEKWWDSPPIGDQ